MAMRFGLQGLGRIFARSHCIIRAAGHAGRLHCSSSPALRLAPVAAQVLQPHHHRYYSPTQHITSTPCTPLRAGISTSTLQTEAASQQSPGATMSPAEAPCPELHVQRHATGLMTLTLDRPKALNAATIDMVEAVRQALAGLGSSGDGPTGGVLVSGSTPRAFCSGGDVKAIRQAVLDLPYEDSPPANHLVHKVFQSEYSLVCAVASCPAPYVSLCDGIWMGFGVGLAGFGAARVVTEKTVFAMPENIIGLWPDVGFAYLAAHMPGACGLYLAMTGARLSTPADLMYTGLASHFVHSERMEALKADLMSAPGGLSEMSEVEGVLKRHAQALEVSSSTLRQLQPLIDRVFRPAHEYLTSGMSLSAALLGIQQRLAEELDARGHKDPNSHSSSSTAAPAGASTAAPAGEDLVVLECTWLEETRGQLQGQCPVSLAVVLRHFAAVAKDVASGGPLSSLPQVMKHEYLMAVRMVRQYNFIEGVRAALVDKDRDPKWQPREWSEISDEQVESICSPHPAGAVGLLL